MDQPRRKLFYKYVLVADGQYFSFRCPTLEYKIGETLGISKCEIESLGHAVYQTQESAVTEKYLKQTDKKSKVKKTLLKVMAWGNFKVEGDLMIYENVCPLFDIGDIAKKKKRKK